MLAAARLLRHQRRQSRKLAYTARLHHFHLFREKRRPCGLWGTFCYRSQWSKRSRSWQFTGASSDRSDSRVLGLRVTPSPSPEQQVHEVCQSLGAIRLGEATPSETHDDVRCKGGKDALLPTIATAVADAASWQIRTTRLCVRCCCSCGGSCSGSLLPTIAAAVADAAATGSTGCSCGAGRVGRDCALTLVACDGQPMTR